MELTLADVHAARAVVYRSLKPTPLLRHALLLTFCAVTYAFAPVAGFGWLLLVMGLAQLEPRQTWLGRAYVVAFVVVLFYDAISWADLVLRVLA